MAALDAKMRAKARSLVDTFGTPATITTYASETYNATTQVVDRTGGADQSVIVSPPSPYKQFMVDGDTIRHDDLMVILPATYATTWTPATGQVLTIGSSKWRIVTVKPLWSGEQVAAYELQLRG